MKCNKGMKWKRMPFNNGGGDLNAVIGRYSSKPSIPTVLRTTSTNPRI